MNKNETYNIQAYDYKSKKYGRSHSLDKDQLNRLKAYTTGGNHHGF